MSYVLEHTEQGIALSLKTQVKWRAYQIDFSQGSIRYRYNNIQGKNELIAKAIGWKKETPLRVLDATAGLGREAFLLAAIGCEVTLFERHPAIASLLKDALSKGAHHPEIAPVIQRMTFVEGCAIAHLQSPSFITTPDVIYCDPMFPHRRKSALVKKEMQLLQTVVGEDNDASSLVQVALSRAKKRVVVKRALDAPVLAEDPDITFKARSHRFDVYLIKRT